ncbi:MAG: hypothetical protein GYB26_09995 [Gammaproteobacteria bacterium]|nr:hypothetical protein [Gammaproteobacteria bacterium]
MDNAKSIQLKQRLYRAATALAKEVMQWITIVLVVTGGLFWGALFVFQFDLTVIAQILLKLLSRYLGVVGY